MRKVNGTWWGTVAAHSRRQPPHPDLLENHPRLFRRVQAQVSNLSTTPLPPPDPKPNRDQFPCKNGEHLPRQPMQLSLAPFRRPLHWKQTQAAILGPENVTPYHSAGWPAHGSIAAAQPDRRPAVLIRRVRLPEHGLRPLNVLEDEYEATRHVAKKQPVHETALAQAIRKIPHLALLLLARVQPETPSVETPHPFASIGICDLVE